MSKCIGGITHDVFGSVGTLLSHSPGKSFGELFEEKKSKLDEFYRFTRDGNGAVIKEQGFDGRVRIEQGEVGLVPFLYQGQYLDTEPGLAYNRFRYYSPETGAYISQDPIRLEAGLTNLYAYVHGVNAWIAPGG